MKPLNLQKMFGCFAGGAIVAGLMFTPVAHADFALLDDLEGYPLGNVQDDDDSPWTAHNTGLFTIMEEAGNQFLGFAWDGNHRSGSRDLPAGMQVAPGEQATLFLQFRPGSFSGSDQSAHFGLAHDVDTGSHTPTDDFRVDVRLRPGPSDAEHFLDVRDGDEWQTLTTVVPGMWHNLWYVVDRTDGDMFELYLNSGTADATAGDLLSYDEGGETVTRFAFRSGGSATDVLDGFLAQGHAGSRTMHLDNLWMDNTGENLAFVGEDLDGWQFAYDSLEAPFSIDFGTGSGAQSGDGLLQSRPQDFALQSDALRYEPESVDLVSSAAFASVENYQARQNFTLEAEMTLRRLDQVGDNRAGLAVLGGPHVPIDDPFMAESDSSFYGLVWFPAVDGTTSVVQIREGFNGAILAEADWGGRHPTVANEGQTGQRMQLEVEGTYDASGLLELSFTMTDQDNFSETISTVIMDGFEGNLFGFGGRASAQDVARFDFHDLSMTVGGEPVEITDPITSWPFLYAFGSEDGDDPEGNFRLNRPEDWSLETDALRLTANAASYHSSLATTRVFNYEPAETFHLRVSATLSEISGDPSDNRLGLVLFGDRDLDTFDADDDSSYYTFQWVPDAAAGPSLLLREGMDGAILAEMDLSGEAGAPEAVAGATYDLGFSALFKRDGSLVFIGSLSGGNGEVEMLGEVENPRDGERFGFGAWHRATDNPVWDIHEVEMAEPEGVGVEALYLHRARVIGKAHDEDRLSYTENVGIGDIGSRGVSGNIRHKNVVLGFQLPSVSAENIVRFELTVTREDGRNSTGAHLYGLLPADPSTYSDGSVTPDGDGVDVWYEGSDLDDRADLVSAGWADFIPTGAPAGNSYTVDVTDFILEFYDESGPTQDEVYFRLSPNTTVAMNNLARTEIQEAFDQDDSPRLRYAVFPPEMPDPSVLWPFAFDFGSIEDRDTAEDFSPNRPGEWSLEEDALRLTATSGDYVNSVTTNRALGFTPGEFSVETRFSLASLDAGASDNRVAIVLFGEDATDVFDPDDDSTYYTVQWIPDTGDGGSLVVREGMDGAEVARTDFGGLANAPQASVGMTYDLGFYAFEEGGQLEFVAGLSDAAGRFASASGTLDIAAVEDRRRFGLGARHRAGENAVWDFERFFALETFLFLRGREVEAPLSWEFGTGPGQLGLHEPLPFFKTRDLFSEPDRLQDWRLTDGALRMAPQAGGNTTSRLRAALANYHPRQDFDLEGQITMVSAGNGPWEQMNFFVLSEMEDSESSGGYAISFEPHQSDGRIRIRQGATGPDMQTMNWEGLYAADGEGTTFTYELSGGFDEAGALTLSFTMTDANGHSQTMVQEIDEPDHGNVFGVAGRGNISGAPTFDFHNVSLSLGEVPEPIGPTFEVWRTEHFSSAELEDSDISGPGATPAGDGIANLIKYAMDLDPHVPVASGDLFDVAVVDGELQLSYFERTDVEDIEYVIEVAEELGGEWRDGPEHTEEIGRNSVAENLDDVTVRALIPDGAARGFMRLVIRLLE